MFNPFNRSGHAAPPTSPAPPEGEPTEGLERRVSLWRPERLPQAVPCVLTTMHHGEPVTGTAILDGEMPLELPLPLELVPPEEAPTAPELLRYGGYFVFADDYVDKYPESNVASMVRAYDQQRSCEDSDDGGLTPSAGNSTATAGNSATTTTTTANPSPTTGPGPGVRDAFRAKTEEVRAVMREVWQTSRPLFRRRGTGAVYTQASYSKRKFHETMDSEYPIEYII